MNFWKDHNDHGPYLDGRTVETGLIFDGPIHFEDRPNDFDGLSPRAIGRFAPATRVTHRGETTIEITGAWKERT